MSARRRMRAGSSAAVAGSALVLLGFAAAPVLADPAANAASAWSLLPAPDTAAASASLERRGRDVFAQRCAACHGPIPEDIHGPIFLPPMPGTQALAARYRGELPAELERRTDLAPAYIRAVVREGFISMPRFRPTEVSAEDLDALVAWLTRTDR